MKVQCVTLFLVGLLMVPLVDAVARPGQVLSSIPAEYHSTIPAVAFDDSSCCDVIADYFNSEASFYDIDESCGTDLDSGEYSEMAQTIILFNINSSCFMARDSELKSIINNFRP